MSKQNGLTFHYDTIAQLIKNYDVVLCDIFGVVHNGVTLYKHTTQLLECFQEQKKEIIFFSNAPRRVSAVEQRLMNFALSKGQHYDSIISSGEVFYQSLKHKMEDWMHNLDKNELYYHIGNANDANIIQDLSYKHTEFLDKADFIIISGIDSDVIYNLEEKHIELVSKLIKLNKPIICINPDVYVPLGSVQRNALCAGALAYEVGRHNYNKLYYYGKPHSNIYNYAINHLLGSKNSSNVNKNDITRRIVAIGDSIETDILGANNNNIDCIFITTGLHATNTATDIKEQLNNAKLKTIANIMLN